MPTRLPAWSTPFAALATLATTAALLLGAPPAHAQIDPEEDPMPTRPVPWHQAFRLVGVGGDINPGVWVAFNPQPEPPIRTAHIDWLSYPPDPTLVLPGQFNPGAGAQLFDLFIAFGAPQLAMSLTPPQLLPGGTDFSTVHTRASSSGGDVVYDIFFDIWASFDDGPLPLTQLTGFNPAPEPPGGPSGRMGMTFAFDADSLRPFDALARMRVVDGAGNPVRFESVVPEPAGLALLGLSLLALTRHRRASRRRNAATPAALRPLAATPAA